MNDDHDLELWLHASAYLDGELDAAEAELAARDHEVMARVAELRQLQDGIREVEQPTARAREAAISAALHEFDAIHRQSAQAAGGAAVERSVRSARPAAYRWLGAVAATVVVVAGFGFLASRGLVGDDDDAGDGVALDAGADVSSQFTAAEESARTFEAPEAEAAGDVMLADDAMASEPTAEAAGGSAEATASEAPPAPAGVDGATTAPAATATEGFVFAPQIPITNEAELAAAGEQLRAERDAEQLVNTPETRCGTDTDRPIDVLSDGYYVDAAGVVRPVLIGVDDHTGDTLALDPETCQPVAVAAAP